LAILVSIAVLFFNNINSVSRSTRCNTCHGVGYWWILSSDEDADVEQCQDCDIIAVQLGGDFARFLQRGWRDLKKSIKGGNENEV